MTTARSLVSAGLVAAALLAGCGGCKKEDSRPPEPKPEPTARVEDAGAAEDAGTMAAAGAEEAGDADAEVVVDDALVARYLAYLKLPRATPASSAAERLEENRRLAKTAGLRWAEAETLRQMMVEVVESRRLYELTGGDQEQEAVRKRLETLPPKKRAELEPQIKAAQANQLKMRDVPAARARWGDAAVDAVIKREKELGEAWDASKK